MQTPQPKIDPPTIGLLKGQGVLGVKVSCHARDCDHRAVVPFAAIPRPDTTEFTSLRFRCEKCQGNNVFATPDWLPQKTGLGAS